MPEFTWPYFPFKESLFPHETNHKRPHKQWHVYLVMTPWRVKQRADDRFRSFVLKIMCYSSKFKEIFRAYGTSKSFKTYFLQMGLIYRVTDCVQSEKYVFDVEELQGRVWTSHHVAQSLRLDKLHRTIQSSYFYVQRKGDYLPFPFQFDQNTMWFIYLSGIHDWWMFRNWHRISNKHQ